MAIILVILVLIYLAYSKVTNEIEVAKNELDLSYSKIERELIVNSINLTRNEIQYLKYFKNFVVNTEFLDPKVNISIRKAASAMPNKLRNQYRNNNGLVEAKYPNLIVHRDGFLVNANNLYKLNMLKFSNWDICIFCTIAYAVQHFTTSKNAMNDLFSRVIGEAYIKNHDLIESLAPKPTYRLT